MLNKKNIAMTMAAATAFTAVAPAVQSFAAVVDTTQEQEIKELKADVLSKFNTKYTENEALKGSKAGKEAYRITMKVDDVDVELDSKTKRTTFDSYAEFERVFNAKFAGLHNGQKIVVTCESTSVRVLEDGTVVDFKDREEDLTVYSPDGSTIDSAVNHINTNKRFIKSLGEKLGKKAVAGKLADGTDYINIPTTNGYIQVKDGDVVLDFDRPIFKVEDGNYVNNEGVAIKKFDEAKVVADADTVFEKGGVIEGYYTYTTGTEDADSDKAVYAIVKNASTATKEDVLTSDLYEASTDRLTQEGNELRKTIIDTVERPKDITTVSNKVKSIVDIYGIDKSGERVDKKDLEGKEAQLAEIKVVFEERENSISEWTPVHEITITEVRGNEFTNVINYVIGNQNVVDGMDLAAGLDRYETSVELSKQGWADGSTDTVVLVSGANDKLVDGLTATPLAAQKNAPVLLTKKDSIPAEVIAEITRLGAKNVYIVGGESAVSNEVETLLTTKYNKNVTRLSGDSRYETSMVVAEELRAQKGTKFDEVFVVGGKGEADALSASAIAGNKKSPILLTNADKLDKDVEGFLKANLYDAGKVNGNNDDTDIFVVGGTNSVSKNVQSQLATIAGTEFEIKRLAGEGRQETNAAVIDEFAGRLDKVVVGKSNNVALVDSLSAGAYAAKTGAHIVLASDTLTDAQEDALSNVALKQGSNEKAKVQAGYGISSTVARFIKALKVTAK